MCSARNGPFFTDPIKGIYNLHKILLAISAHLRPGSKLNHDYLVIVFRTISQNYMIETYGFHHMKEQSFFFDHILIK